MAKITITVARLGLLEGQFIGGEVNIDEGALKRMAETAPGKSVMAGPNMEDQCIGTIESAAVVDGALMVTIEITRMPATSHLVPTVRQDHVKTIFCLENLFGTNRPLDKVLPPIEGEPKS